jgi:hypothetical protein
MILILGVWAFVRALLVNSAAVSLENVALRHQPAVLQRSGGRPRLRRRDRIFWVCLSQRAASTARGVVTTAVHDPNHARRLTDSEGNGVRGPDTPSRREAQQCIARDVRLTSTLQVGIKRLAYNRWVYYIVAAGLSPLAHLKSRVFDYASRDGD